MQTLRIGIVQHRCVADSNSNRARLAQSIHRLAAQGAHLIVLPELHDTLYFCQTEDVDNCSLAVPIPGAATDYYAALARAEQVVLVVSLFERCAAGLHYNTAVVLDRDGTIAGKYRKMHIPDDPTYYEKFYFAPGDSGFHPITTSIGRIGVQVCWDQWYPEGARLMALAGAEILVYPTAIGYSATDSPQEQQRQRTAWQTIQRGHAIANGLPVVAVNRVGHEADPTGHSDGIAFWGSSFVAGPQGELLFTAAAEDEQEAVVEVDMARSETVRRWWPFLRDRRIDAYGDLLRRYREEEDSK